MSTSAPAAARIAPAPPAATPTTASAAVAEQPSDLPAANAAPIAQAASDARECAKLDSLLESARIEIRRLKAKLKVTPKRYRDRVRELIEIQKRARDRTIERKKRESCY